MQRCTINEVCHNGIPHLLFLQFFEIFFVKNCNNLRKIPKVFQKYADIHHVRWMSF